MDSSLTFLTTTRKPSPVSKKPLKHKKKKNKPIKVRYISNPMKVQICASKFRDLVQELTGQDALDLPQDLFYSPSSSDDHNPSPPPPCTAENLVNLHQVPLDDMIGEGNYEPLDTEEMFLPHMSTGFSEFLLNGIYNVNGF